MADIKEIGKNPEEVNERLADVKGIKTFFGDKEEQFFINAGREITETILQSSFYFYKIDIEKTKVHPLYAEAKVKRFFSPIEIFGRINVEDGEPEYQVDGGIIKKGFGKLTAHIYIEHLRELNLIDKENGNIIITKVKMGDFINYHGQWYRISDDGYSQISNEHSFGGDRRFFITIKGIEVDEDIFKGR